MLNASINLQMQVINNKVDYESHHFIFFLNEE